MLWCLVLTALFEYPSLRIKRIFPSCDLWCCHYDAHYPSGQRQGSSWDPPSMWTLFVLLNLRESVASWLDFVAEVFVFQNVSPEMHWYFLNAVENWIELLYVLEWSLNNPTLSWDWVLWLWQWLPLTLCFWLLNHSANLSQISSHQSHSLDHRFPPTFAVCPASPAPDQIIIPTSRLATHRAPTEQKNTRKTAINSINRKPRLVLWNRDYFHQ